MCDAYKYETSVFECAHRNSRIEMESLRDDDRVISIFGLIYRLLAPENLMHVRYIETCVEPSRERQRARERENCSEKIETSLAHLWWCARVKVCRTQPRSSFHRFATGLYICVHWKDRSCCLYRLLLCHGVWELFRECIILQTSSISHFFPP